MKLNYGSIDQFFASLTVEQRRLLWELLHLTKEDSGRMERLCLELLVDMFPNPKGRIRRRCARKDSRKKK